MSLIPTFIHLSFYMPNTLSEITYVCYVSNLFPFQIQAMKSFCTSAENVFVLQQN